MTKLIKYGLWAIAGLLVLAVAGAAIVAATFDPNKYKPQIERLAKERTGRTLKLAGNLELAFFPSLGAKVAGVSLSERASEQSFVSLESAQVSVKLLPLLSGDVIVDGLRLSGLKAQVVKGKDGKFNFDDLIEGGAVKKPAAKPTPAKGGEPPQFAVSGIKIERSSVTYRDLAAGSELALADFGLATGRVALENQVLSVPKLSVEFTVASPELPMKSIKLAIAGSLQADLGKETLEAKLVTKLDESTVETKLGLARFAPPSYRFDIDIDRLNVDRYLPSEPAKPAGAAKPAAVKEPADAPVDLSFLKGLDASGKLHVGVLQVRGLKLATLRAEIKAANGRMDVAPHSASLYEGAIAGVLTLQADGNRIALKETLTGISIGPLLRDVAETDRLEGKGNVALDVTSFGKTVGAMKKALAGTAKVELKDGALKGIDIAGVLRQAKSALRGQSAAAGGSTERSDFSALSASFAIKNGVARNEDLDVKAPAFRVAGRGDIDIGNSRLDYTTKASVVSTSKGQGGGELGQVSGLTVPVRLTGTFDNLKYDVNYGAVAADLAKSRAGEKLKERLGDEKVKERLKGLFGR